MNTLPEQSTSLAEKQVTEQENLARDREVKLETAPLPTVEVAEPKAEKEEEKEAGSGEGEGEKKVEEREEETATGSKVEESGECYESHMYL